MEERFDANISCVSRRLVPKI